MANSLTLLNALEVARDTLRSIQERAPKIDPRLSGTLIIIDATILAHQHNCMGQPTITDLRRKIWNAAIEAAALVVQPVPHIDEERTCGEVAASIRALSQQANTSAKEEK